MSNRRIANCIDAIGEAIVSVDGAIREVERARRALAAGVSGAGNVSALLGTVRDSLVVQRVDLARLVDLASGLLEGGDRG